MMSVLWQDYTAKLSDFGLAKEGPQGDDTHVTTRVMGTHGYAAPEYILTGMHVVNWSIISINGAASTSLINHCTILLVGVPGHESRSEWNWQRVLLR